MSYSEFPPPISSSPPPLDPQQLEDDDFETQREHSPTFDITGLSEKLPPTPYASPVRRSLPSNQHDERVPNEQIHFSSGHLLEKDDLTNPEKDPSNTEVTKALSTLPSILPYESFSANSDVYENSNESVKCETSLQDLFLDEDNNARKNFHRQIVNDEHYDALSDNPSFNDFKQAKGICKTNVDVEISVTCDTNDTSTVSNPVDTDASCVRVDENETFNMNNITAEDLPAANSTVILPEDSNIGNFPHLTELNEPISEEVVNIGEKLTHLHDNNETPIDEQKHNWFGDIKSGTNVKTKKITEPEFESFANFESASVESSNSTTFKANFSSESEVSCNPCDIIAEDVVISCSLPTIEGINDASPDDDFGYQDMDGGADSDNSSPAPMVEATNELVIKPTETSQEESLDDDFNEFVTSAGPQEEFDEYASAKIDNAFGEFATVSLGQDVVQPDEEEVEFGEWNDAMKVDEGKTDSLTGSLVRGSRNEATAGMEPPVHPLMDRFEALVRRWLGVAESVAVASTTVLLRDVVAGDAFVWRKLECVEWHSVAWHSSVAHQLLLTAMHMDARNILYNPKWSSCVPLFAQSLSFSPLTPAKPTTRQPLPHAAPSTPPPITLHHTQGPPPVPAPQFDWLTSGLSDPLTAGPSVEASYAVQQLLAQTISRSRTAVEQLTHEQQLFLQTLPDLGFMTSKALMFPITGRAD